MVALIVVIITFWKYWRKRNVPYLEPRIPFGNMEEVIRGRKLVGIGFKEMKRRGWKRGGFYTFTKSS
jgi:cytochrome P450 family 6